MCADLALCSCRKNLPGCGKSPLPADQGARWPYRLSPGKRVIIIMSCHEDNGNDDNTKMKTAMKTTAMITKRGVTSVCNMCSCLKSAFTFVDILKCQYFTLVKFVMKKNNQSLTILRELISERNDGGGVWGGNISGCRKLNCHQERGPSRLKNKRNMIQLLTEQPSCLLNGPQSPTNIYNVLTNHFGQEMFSAGLYIKYYKKQAFGDLFCMMFFCPHH